MNEDQKNQNHNPDQKAPEPALDKESDAGGSISLAKKFKLGPFKPKKRHKNSSGDPSAMKANAPKEIFAAVAPAAQQSSQQPQQKRTWNYEGTLPDSRVRILAHHSSDLAYVNAVAAMRETKREYAFVFNKNGMHYKIEFQPPVDDMAYGEDAAQDKFKICMHDDTHKLAICGRSMSREEAEYAMDTVEQALHSEDKKRLAGTLTRLRQNMPTDMLPGKDKSWDEYLEECKNSWGQPKGIRIP